MSGLYAIIGERIRNRREVLGWKQEDLASVMGMSRTSVTQAESGHQRLSLETLYQVAAALGIGIADLLPTLQDLKPPATDIFAQLDHDPQLSDASRIALRGFFERCGGAVEETR